MRTDVWCFRRAGSSASGCACCFFAFLLLLARLRRSGEAERRRAWTRFDRARTLARSSKSFFQPSSLPQLSVLLQTRPFLFPERVSDFQHSNFAAPIPSPSRPKPFRTLSTRLGRNSPFRISPRDRAATLSSFLPPLLPSTTASRSCPTPTTLPYDSATAPHPIEPRTPGPSARIPSRPTDLSPSLRTTEDVLFERSMETRRGAGSQGT